ncbi:MAG: flagellar hook assembly protein FlgD [Pseudolabrys sp.]
MATIPSTGTTGTSNPASSTSLVANQEIASNFTTFLQMLTTQLKNQDPTSPMDTNQFTQQLVEFAQVEQQMQQNSQLTTLVSLQQAQQSTALLSYVGATVAVDGSSAALKSGTAGWNLTATKPATATVTITDSTGQTAYKTTVAVNAGAQSFVWNGMGNDGKQWPDGTYKISVTAVDANNQPTSVATEVQGRVDSVDLTQTPPTLSINGQDYALTQIKRIVASN